VKVKSRIVGIAGLSLVLVDVLGVCGFVGCGDIDDVVEAETTFSINQIYQFN
jgi:hypothetical protein